MRVFVTGATGFVGREVVRRLHQAEHAIRVLARNPDSQAIKHLQADYSVDVLQGDVLKEETLPTAVRGSDAVIHLVGVISESGATTFENVHVHGTRNMLAAAHKTGVGRFLHMSALGTRPNAVSRYHQTKWAAEESVRTSGLAWTIFRPSLIYGPEDHFVNLFARIARLSPILPVLGTRTARFQPVAVETVASCFVGSLEEPWSISQTYDLCGLETLTMDEMLEAILAALRRRRWKLQVPLTLARMQAAFLEWFYPRVLRRPPPLNRDQLIMLQEDNIGNADTARSLFGISGTSFREGIAKYLQS